jgi:hypothetical protein
MPNPWDKPAATTKGNPWDRPGGASFTQSDGSTVMPPDITANPNGQGVYKMAGPNGPVGVPFSNVLHAQQTGYKLDPADQARFTKDYVGAPIPTLPSVPSTAPSTPLSRLTGTTGLGDAATVVGQHLKNMIAAPFHAVTDKPDGAVEKTVAALGPGSLPIYRSLIKPTVNAVGTAIDQAKAGNLGLNTKPTYDAAGNYTPTALSSAMDAIPLAGPWSRSIENDAEQHGALPALAGLGTDILGPKAGGAIVSKALSTAAPVLAETALKVRGADRGYGATPGAAILDNTSGLTPRAVVDSARTSMDDLQTKQTAALGNSTGMVPLAPTRGIGAGYADRGLEENHPATVKDMGKLNNQLAFRVNDTTGNFDTAQPIPNSVRPIEAAALNRGLSAARGGFNPLTTSPTVDAAAGEMHHQLAASIADVAPDVAPINQQIQSLIPVLKRATAADLNAGPMQRMIARVGAHSGALLGATAGYHFGGIPGAIAGFAGPELLTSPEAGLAAARLSNAIAPVVKASPLPLTALSVTGKKAADRQ